MIANNIARAKSLADEIERELRSAMRTADEILAREISAVVARSRALTKELLERFSDG